MAKYIGDIHLGYKRKSYTTKAGARRYEEALFKLAYTSFTQGGHITQVGDLFDGFRTDDITTLRAIKLLENTGSVIAGNHDLRNTKGSNSTLELLSIDNSSIVIPKYDEATVKVEESSHGVNNYLVPYHYTQELFLDALDQAQNIARGDSKTRVLVLHCNYECPWDMEETVNNLTEERALKLLVTFDYIVCGHEHNSRLLLDDRLIMTGSLMPLSSSEYTDKYVWEINNTGVHKHLAWKASDRVLKCDASIAPDRLDSMIQFVSLTGSISEMEQTQVLKKIKKWWETSKNLLVCKPEYTVRKPEDVVNTHHRVGVDIKANIRSQLTGRPLELFNELMETQA